MTLTRALLILNIIAAYAWNTHMKMLSTKPGACHQTEWLQAREAGRHCH